MADLLAKKLSSYCERSGVDCIHENEKVEIMRWKRGRIRDIQKEVRAYGCGLKFKTARNFIADEYEFLMVTLEHAAHCSTTVIANYIFIHPILLLQNSFPKWKLASLSLFVGALRILRT